jgi:hypothetical protein
MYSAIAEYTSRIALGKPGLQICLYFLTGSGSNKVTCDLCTFVVPVLCSLSSVM